MVSDLDTVPRPSHLTRRLILCGLLWLWVLLAVSHAQLTLDGSLGPPGPLAGPQYRIPADVGQIRGSNLFHSFGAFNVPSGGSATFTGPATIANILSRVTGGQPSAIDGLLRSEIAGVHLYLLNPSGVLFGPNARLEVSGSFHVSTADFLRFTDGATFPAHLGQASVLTVAEPAAFGFLRNTPAPITIQGSSLRVNEGKALSVVGGDLEIVGSGPVPVEVLLNPFLRSLTPTLTAPGGRLQLASVASPGEVRFSPLELAPELQVDSFAQLGRIALSQGAFLWASGPGGGTVLLRGGRLRVDNAQILVGNFTPMARTGLGIDLRIAADAVLTNGGRANASGLNVQLTAGSLSMERAVIGVSGGNITVTIAAPTVPLGGGGIMTLTGGTIGSSPGAGQGGMITITAPTLRVDNGGGIFTNALGWGSPGGALRVEVGDLILTGGGQIGSLSFVDGHGGPVTITASNAVVITGNLRVPSSDVAVPSGIIALTLPAGVLPSFIGSAGDITITTPTLRLEDGGVIATTTLTTGRAGDLRVDVERLILTGEALIDSSTALSGQTSGFVNSALLQQLGFDPEIVSGDAGSSVGSGPAGNIDLRASDIQLAEGASISATSASLSNAGNIRITARNTFQSVDSTVTTEARLASGGNIALTAGSQIQVRESRLTTSVAGGGETVGGNLALDAPLIISDGSQISATAVAGRGGNIGIGAQVFLADPASQVSASSDLGIQGTVDIRAPVTTLSGTLAPLSQVFVNAAALLPARCAARAQGGRYSSLVLGGRDGLPPDPSGVLPSPLALEERLVADSTVTGASPRQTSAGFAFLADAEKAWPRLRGDQRAFGCTR